MVTLNIWSLETFRLWVDALKPYTVYLKDIAEDYSLQECIGTGKFGRVFKAKDYSSDQSVAVKIFSRNGL